MSEKDFLVYEAGFLLSPSFNADEASSFISGLKSKIETLGGENISFENPKQIALSYEMSREVNNKKKWFNEAIFSWVKFKFDPKEIYQIEEALKKDESVIRFLLIKTSAENTIYGNRVNLLSGKKKRERVEKEPKDQVGINKEEVDKKIDEIVSVE